MKNLLLSIFMAISINSLGQNWIDYQIDPTLTLTIPEHYQAIDTLGQRIITARVYNGVIIISTLPNSGGTAMNVESEEELIKSYKAFERGYIRPQHGQLIKEEIVENSGLKMIRFSFKAAIGSEKQIRYCVSVFVNEKMYAISFWEPESMTNEMSATREKLFSSLRFSRNLGLNNQMSYKPERDKAYNQGLLLGKITSFGLVIGLVFWLSKRRRKKIANVSK